MRFFLNLRVDFKFSYQKNLGLADFSSEGTKTGSLTAVSRLNLLNLGKLRH